MHRARDAGDAAARCPRSAAWAPRDARRPAPSPPASTSSVRQRSRTVCTSSPLLTLSAPRMVRRVLRAADEHHGRRAAFAPAGSQRRELAQRRLIGHPDLATGGQHRRALAAITAPFFRRRPDRAVPARTAAVSSDSRLEIGLARRSIAPGGEHGNRDTNTNQRRSLRAAGVSRAGPQVGAARWGSAREAGNDGRA